MVRALPFRTPTRLDFGRVLAIATAIALHMVVLLLLLMPMAAPQLVPLVQPKPIIRWIEREKPVEPINVPVDNRPKPTTITPPQTTVHQQTATPPAETPVIVDGGSEPVAVAVSAPPGDVVGPAIVSGPIAASHLEYVTAPAPRYPADAIRSGATGTVMLRVLVDIDGTPLEVSIDRSSGNKSLDREARAHVLKKWRFKPAMQDGMAVQAYGIVPISFTLQ